MESIGIRSPSICLRFRWRIRFSVYIHVISFRYLSVYLSRMLNVLYLCVHVYTLVCKSIWINKFIALFCWKIWNQRNSISFFYLSTSFIKENIMLLYLINTVCYYMCIVCTICKSALRQLIILSMFQGSHIIV